MFTDSVVSVRPGAAKAPVSSIFAIRASVSVSSDNASSSTLSANSSAVSGSIAFGCSAI